MNLANGRDFLKYRHDSLSFRPSVLASSLLPFHPSIIESLPPSLDIPAKSTLKEICHNEHIIRQLLVTSKLAIDQL